MEINSENPFKDCKMLKLNGETTDPTIVYLDDEEISNANNSSSEDDEENVLDHPLHVKISSDFNDDDESNQSMVVEPDDQIVASEVAIKEENSSSSESSCDEDICLKFEPSSQPIFLPPEEIACEEQFEVIPNSEEKIDDKIQSNHEDDKSAVAVDAPHDQSFESTGSASGSTSNDHDHSYSQTNQEERTSYCDDIVEDILAQCQLKENPKAAVELLTKFTDFFEIHTCNEDPNSQISQYVQRMKDTLYSKRVGMTKPEKEIEIKQEPIEVGEKIQNLTANDVDEEMPLIEPQNDPVEKDIEFKPSNDENEIKAEEVIEDKTSEEQNDCNQLTSLPSIELFHTSQAWDDSIFDNFIENKEDLIDIEESPVDTKQSILADDNQPKSPQIENSNKANESEAMDVSCDVVKEEPMEKQIIFQNQVSNCDDEKVEIKTDEAEKLQACIKNAADVGNLFTSIQDLSSLVYETDEDIKNGKSKLLTSLQSIIKHSCKLMMEIEDVQEKVDMRIDEFIDSTMLNLSNAYTNGGVKKEEKKSDTSDSSSDDEIDDEEINKLCNINALKISKGNRDIEKVDTVPVKKLTKKKEKKLKAFSDDSDMLSSDDEDVNNSEPSKKKENKSDEENSSDEEKKMIEKHESNVKNMLLVSTDDEDSDESTYATSESSLGDLPSDHEAEKPTETEKKKIVEPKPKVESESDDERSEKEKPAKLEPQTPSKESVKESGDESSNEKDTSKVRKPKQRQMDGMTREIFKKDFLDLESDDESQTNKYDKVDRPKETNSITSISSSPSKESKSTRNDNDAIDLSQYTARQSEIKTVDLTKYIEKKISEKITDQQQSTKPQTPIEEDDCFIISSDSDSEVSSTHEKTRRRKELSPEELKEETKKAQKAEKERIKKLEKKKDVMSQYHTERLSQQSMDDDIICENDLILDYSKKQKKAIEVHPKLVDKLKNHQKEGIQFMYDNCFGNVDDVKEDNGSGCILAHCMGLGKTLQLIALIHTLTRYPELLTNRILVICPKTTIYNWFEEFQKWLGGIPSRGMKVGFLEENMKIEQKLKKIEEWYESKNPSVFLINYESFRSLVNWSGSHKKAKLTLPDDVVKKYQAKISKYLLDPGPQMVVCDEGHMIKNQKGAANRAISKVTTKRRIILTGTPIQNNLAEYYAMVHWIKPCYLGDIKEFNNLYANPIKEGQLKDSTPYQIKKMKQKCFVLNKMLDKFVQRKEASILKEFLPEKFEYCLSVPLTEPQAELYKKFLEANPFSETRGKQLLPDYTALRKIWTHPRVLQYARERALRGENKFTEPQKKIRNPMLAENEEDENEVPDDIHDISQGLTGVKNDWYASIANDDQLKSLYSSHKLLILFELLKRAQMRGEKVLVFTAFVAVLDVIEQFMREIDDQDNNPKAMLYGYDQYRTTWKLGKDYLRLDGSTPREVRHKMINEFNKTENQRLRCFLISAKAGGQGINLIGANRCVLIDTSWNPSSDQQNIFRIFRLGQKKPCYVYRLVALGTMEEKIYSRSVTKQAMSGRVVDRQIIDRHYRGDELEQLYQFTEYDPKDRETPVMPKDDVLKFLLMNYQQQIYNYHDHDSLLENKPEQDLSEVEKKEAWDLYENEQRAHANRLHPMLGNLYPQQQQQQYGNGGGLDLNYEMMNLNNILNQYPQYNNYPSTSANALDYNALSKSYFNSLNSSMYTNELYKKFQQVYDPISMFAAQSSLPLPPVSTITSSSSSALPTVSTNASNSLMSSLLRSPLAPLTVPPAHSLSSIPTTYNANSIPLSSTSMFSNKPPSLNPTSISSAPVNTTTSTTAAASTSSSSSSSSAALTSKSNVQTAGSRSLVKPNTLKRPNIQVDQLSQALTKMTSQSNKRSDALTSMAKGSSAAISILPDNEIRRTVSNGSRTQIKPIDKGMNNAQLSAARTNAPYIRPELRRSASATVIDQLKKTVTLPKGVTRVNPGIPQSVMRPIMTAPRLQVPPRPQISLPRQQGPRALQKKMPGNITNQRVNTEFMRKTQTGQRLPNAQVSGIYPKKTSIDPAIQKQLEKNQTSMTEATRPLKITSVVPTKSTENSVSIIALKPNTSTALPARIQKPPQAVEVAITPSSNAKKIVQTGTPKGTIINRPTTSGNKFVISPQYSQGTKRSSDINTAAAVPNKKIRTIQVPQILRNPNPSQQQFVTARTNIVQPQSQQMPNKRPANNLPLEIVELE